MKKKNIVAIIIILLVAIGITSYFIYNKIIEEGRKYEIEEVKEFNYFILKEGNKYGVLSKEGKTIIKADYSSITIPNPEKAVFICEDGGNTKVLNANNETIFKNYEKVEAIRLKNIASSLMYEKSVLAYTKDGKMGLINYEEKEITKPIYDFIEALPYKEGELIASENNKVGIINIKGNEIIKAKYNQITVDNYFVENEGYKYAGYIISEKTEDGYRYGYLDLNGNEIIKPEYNDLNRVTDIEDKETVYLIAAKNGKYGVLKNDEEIIPNEYQSIRYDKPNNIFVVEKTKRYGVITIEGKEILPTQYGQIDITGIYIYAKKDDNTEVFDSKGNLANIDINTSILKTQNDNYKIKIENNEGKTHYSIIDKNDKEITKNKYAYLDYYRDNYFIASTGDGKLGIIDINEEPKIKIEYDSIEQIKNTDLIKTIINANSETQIYTKDFKLINTLENAIIENKGEYIKVYNTEETKYLDLEGNEKNYSQIDNSQNLYAKKLENGSWTFVNQSGKSIDNQYDKVTEFNKYGFAGIKKDGKWGSIGIDGKVIQEPIYEFSNNIEPDFIGNFYKVEYGLGEIYYTTDK